MSLYDDLSDLRRVDLIRLMGDVVQAVSARPAPSPDEPFTLGTLKAQPFKDGETSFGVLFKDIKSEKGGKIFNQYGALLGEFNLKRTGRMDHPENGGFYMDVEGKIPGAEDIARVQADLPDVKLSLDGETLVVSPV